MDIDLKSITPLLAFATSVVSINFLSKKDKINRRDGVVERSIELKHDTEDLILSIFTSLIENNTNPDELGKKRRVLEKT